ncbi:MAG: aldo/keto reductase [Betaproteobacteria bacterium HGW-Betaproteobacteria-12]|nr:MAG: aldo/keto reductase [Betaproteobacteria bacterium HGW-Betaproteobacteria-12]
MTRAAFLRLAAGGATALLLGATPTRAVVPLAMQQRPVPGSGELLPVIGLGTWQGFDFVPGSPEYARLPAVLEALFAAGGAVIDSSPMYGRAEENVGDLLAATGSHRRAFIASKVWISGREEGRRQLTESRRRLRAGPRLDLMQVHNLVDWRTQLATLRDWQASGRLRYIGVSHYHAGAYAELAAVLRAERLDFLQINYSLDEREAERSILPLAAERGLAVLINRPFGGGALLRRLRNKPLPAWAAEIEARSWAQLLLKFVLAQPAVTCAIPGTSRPEHMADNAGAGRGPLPDAAFWRRHPELFAL